MKRPSHPLQSTNSRTEQERSYAVAKKVLRHFELKSELVDVFSKRQKQFLFNIIFDFPVVRAEKEGTIPRRFLDNIRYRLLYFMKHQYFGNPENKLTYIEFATYGVGFINAIRLLDGLNMPGSTPQQIDAVRQMHEKFPKIEQLLMEKGFAAVFNVLLYLTRSFSQVNFRLYGFNYKWEVVSVAMRMKIELTSQNCESKIFRHNGIKRKAFRLVYTEDGIYEQEWATVPRNKIFPKAKEDEVLNIYIQSHVLHRFKERIDIFDAPDRNYILQSSLTYRQQVVATEKQTFLSCRLGDSPIGYFTFFVQDDDIVLNTFIPLVSENTPEGKKLHELLPLGKEGAIYLGMDKISFLLSVDFDQIPILKQALIDSGVWKAREAIELKAVIEGNKDPIDINKTLFVKKFFDRISEKETEESHL
jgi:hypothetical protein